MQEMRIVPEISGYDELVEKLTFELMDGKLGTPEEMKAFLDPYSPPAPPPTVHLRRARGTRKDAKAAKSRKKAEEDEVSADEGEGLEENGDGAGLGEDGATSEAEAAAENVAPAIAAKVKGSAAKGAPEKQAP